MSIKIITQPSVFVVGRQTIDEGELARFLADEGVDRWETDTTVAGQKLVEVAGRLCYMSYAKPRPGGNAAYLGHLLDVAHGSCLEHCVFNLIITGVSRSLTHELVRHRAGYSFSQLSQRYVDESDVAFVVPPALKREVEAGENWLIYSGQESARSSLREIKPRQSDGWRPSPYTYREGAGLRWLAAMEQTQADYLYLSDVLSAPDKFPDLDKTERRKAAREAARSVLPNATETKVFITANARALRHFLELRGSRYADAEINRLALATLVVLQAEAPNLFGDYRVTDLGDGRREIATPHRKV